MMKLFWEIYVEDIVRAERFYDDIVGLKVTRRLRNFLVMECDSAKIHICLRTDAPLYLNQNSTCNIMGTWTEFVFEVDNIVKVYEKVKKSAYPMYEELTDQEWGKTDFRVVGPAGEYVRITSKRISENKYAHLEIKDT